MTSKATVISASSKTGKYYLSPRVDKNSICKGNTIPHEAGWRSDCPYSWQYVLLAVLP